MTAARTIEVPPKKGPESESLVAVAPTPVELLRIAVSQGADIEKLKQLMDLQERWEKNEARKAFVSAMNAFKSDPPQILKNKDVAFGNTKYSHATLDHVCDAIGKALGQHGISYRWSVDQTGGEWIKVTCILTHDLGHSEETTLQGCADNSGSKNSIQAIGSTVTYLQRYTLLAATGLAAANADNDGRGGPQQTSATKKLANLNEHMEWLENASSREELERLFRQAYREASQAGDKAAQTLIIRKKDELKARF